MIDDGIPGHEYSTEDGESDTGEGYGRRALCSCGWKSEWCVYFCAATAVRRRYEDHLAWVVFGTHYVEGL